MAKLGNPQESLKVIHVAGTNGKGSTCAFLQHILMAADFKVGVFTSPHLHRYNERIVIGSKPISDSDFARWLYIVAKAADKRPSFFEILTCMAFAYFAEKSVDIAIIETGIGGRLDSTNVTKRSLLSVITAPGYDHQELLGETLSEIASEDAGIIKEDCPVAVYPTSVLPVIESIAKDKNAFLYYIGDCAEITDKSFSLNGTEFSVKTAYFSYQSLRIRLLGEHQVHNAVHALLCAKALNIADEAAIRKGLARCRWPGRFELMSQEPYVILDGAHNVDGARIFTEALIHYFTGRHIVLVVGISKHKDYRNILFYLQAAADTVVCTCARFKAMPAEDLAACVKKPVIIEKDCNKALRLAVKLAGPEGVVAVAGSLYLVGDLYKARCVNSD